MPRADLPADVARFLEEHLRSVDELEVLLFLRGHRLAEWNGRGVGELVGIAPAAADALLERLHARGLVAVRESPSRLYHYAPQSTDLANAVDRLAGLAAQRQFAVASFLLSRQANAAPVRAAVLDKIRSSASSDD